MPERLGGAAAGGFTHIQWGGRLCGADRPGTASVISLAATQASHYLATGCFCFERVWDDAARLCIPVSGGRRFCGIQKTLARVTH